jgi:thioredoxin reductase (NADPH)
MFTVEATHSAIVVGAGPAGMKAAKDLANNGVSTALVDDGYMGGLIANVGDLTGPEGIEGQSGADVAGILLGNALEAGVDYRMGTAASLEQHGNLWILPELELSAPNVVVATGARLAKLGVPGEERLTGFGVSSCAFCDGALYRGEEVVVVGGGDAAFQEALHLATLCKKVQILIRGPEPRARHEFRAEAEGKTNIEIKTDTSVLEVVGDTGVDAIDVNCGGSVERIETRALFVFVGVEPATELVPTSIARDTSGALIVDHNCQTSISGLFAIGAARSGHNGQVSGAYADANLVAAAITG